MVNRGLAATCVKHGLNMPHEHAQPDAILPAELRARLRREPAALGGTLIRLANLAAAAHMMAQARQGGEQPEHGSRDILVFHASQGWLEQAASRVGVTSYQHGTVDREVNR